MHKRYHIVSGLLILLLVLLCGCAKTDGESPDLAGPAVGTANEPPAQSEPQSEEESAPIFITFEGMDLEGNTISEDVFLQSKLTMVNVWATYCGPCLNEMPGLGELAAEHDRAEFQIIGIVSDVREGEDPSLVEELVQQTGADYPHLLANASIDQAFLAGVSGVPTTFFFDGEGAYLGGIVGAADKSTWEELIHELLEEA
ncbi:TlpA disulfide reductase family protein [Lawsonibacter sp. JLR.KK007]|jgi:thiol-disulfide isomerase/thioredoxin|uniref:TlpA disulfide reductase family protein n=1 Tax=Lawsonibacter sp. JLR.KK007 TaxID=3114293 RepID=UPI0026382AC1|nr:TlpA disulfide reductase family protein [uncultured Oscillibacter sp.]